MQPAPIGVVRVHESPPASAEPRYRQLVEVAVAHLPHLRRLACRLCANPAEVDDLVQDTYCLALLHHRQLRSLEDCRAWLTTILRRCAIARHRHREVGPRLVYGHLEDSGDAIDLAISSRAAFDAVELREIRERVDDLPSAQADAWKLRELDGFSYEEIATLTRAPVGTVRSRIARARAALMRDLRANAEACGLGCRPTQKVA